jgi:hypothetical protein
MSKKLNINIQASCNNCNNWNKNDGMENVNWNLCTDYKGQIVPQPVMAQTTNVTRLENLQNKTLDQVRNDNIEPSMKCKGSYNGYPNDDCNNCYQYSTRMKEQENYNTGKPSGKVYYVRERYTTHDPKCCYSNLSNTWNIQQNYSL